MPKKILMLNYEYPPLGGGAANATRYLLREFSQEAYAELKIELVTSSSRHAEVRELSNNIRVHLLDIRKGKDLEHQSYRDLLSYSLKARIHAGRLLRKERFDLIHAFFGIPCGYIAMRLGRKHGLPYIVSLRGSDVPFYNERFRTLDRYFFRHISRHIWRGAAHVVANSEGLRDLALRTAPMQRIKVIPNGVDTEEFSVKDKRGHAAPLKLISTGRLIRRKGYQFLLPALKGLDVELILVGDGTMRDELERLAAENDVRVSFRGQLAHEGIAESLREADVFVLPSLNEGMANSALEAMACGKPVIMTRTGGSEELMRGNGLIIEKGSVESIREAIRKYIKYPGLIREHGSASRGIAQTMSWGEVARQYRELYEI